MADLKIQAVIQAVDKVTGPINSVNSSLNKLENGTKKANKAGVALGTSFTQSFTRIAAGFIGANVAMAAFRGVMRSTFTLGMEFESTLVSAAAKFGKGAERGTATFDSLKESAKKAGLTTEFTAAQAAEGLDYMALAGFNAEQSIKALPGVINLATAAGLDLGTASDIATDALGAFGLMSKDSGQLEKNLQRVNDVMLKTGNTYNENVQQMFEAVRMAAPAGASLGVEIEKFGVYSGVLASAGLKGSIAGTQLRMMFLRLAAPVGEGGKLLKKLGIQTKDSKGNLLDVTKILGQLEGKLSKFGSATKANVLTKIFGQEAITGVNNLLSYGVENLAADEKKIQDSFGETARIAAEKRNTMYGSMKSAQSAFESFGNMIFERLYPVIRGMFDGIASFFRFMTNNPGMQALVVFVGIFTSTLLILVSVLKMAAIATAIWNAVLLANPLTWIVLAIAAVVAIGYLLISNFGAIYGWVKKTWNAFSAWLMQLGVVRWAIKHVCNLFELFWTQAKAVWSFMTTLLAPMWHGFIEVLASVWRAIDTYLIQPFLKLLDILGLVLGKFAEFSAGAVGKIAAVFGYEAEAAPQNGAAAAPGAARANEMDKNLIVPPVASTAGANVSGKIAVNFNNPPPKTTYSSSDFGGIGLKLGSSGGFR